MGPTLAQITHSVRLIGSKELTLYKPTQYESKQETCRLDQPVRQSHQAHQEL